MRTVNLTLFLKNIGTFFDKMKLKLHEYIIVCKMGGTPNGLKPPPPGKYIELII